MHEAGNMIIEGARVQLLPISEDDTKNIVKWRNHVRGQFLDRRLFTEESHNYWLHTMVETGKVAQFVIEVKGKDKIGSVFLRDIDRKNKKAEFGIFIGEDRYQGKGYGTEATELILQYGFRQLGLHKITLRVLEKNKRAIGSYEKAGFKKEGCFVDDVFVDDQYENIIYMAIFEKQKETD